MVSLIFGIIFIAFTVFSILPAAPLAWGDNVVEFLKGFLPVLSAFIGLVAILIGIADIKDKKEAKREEIEAAKTSK
ncbi:MAG: hypothetical protein HDR35_08805 [Treponema sp.]|nr:hypothetical protein [Treponema sp.]